MIDDFWIAATALLLGAIVWVLVLPRYWQRKYPTETNEDWLRLRQRELAGESEQLQQEAALRLIEDGIIDDVPRSAGPLISSRAAQWAGVVLLTVSVLSLYQHLGSWEDVNIARALSDVERAQPADIIALISRIETRAEARPANADYALLLGEYYLSGNDPTAAFNYFDRLVVMGASAPEILGKAAQAEFLANDRQLSATARARAEQALAVNTAEPAALATLGMAAFEESDFRAAIQYWQRLQALEPPGSPGYTMLAQIIERARVELGEAPTVLADESLAGAAPAISSKSPGVDVVVRVPEGALVPPNGSVVFVLARAAGTEQGMPIAVSRTQPERWPLSVRLDDGQSMAGQLISEITAVSIEVQVSIDGQPGRDNALYWGRVDAVTVGGVEPVVIALTGQ
ncbi:MAG: cytochrome C biogenesis protein [Halieaceae bacterium]|nr:cytochrome C biogenesis protein [Halieaceae bacterium]